MGRRSGSHLVNRRSSLPSWPICWEMDRMSSRFIVAFLLGRRGYGMQPQGQERVENNETGKTSLSRRRMGWSPCQERDMGEGSGERGYKKGLSGRYQEQVRNMSPPPALSLSRPLINRRNDYA